MISASERDNLAKLARVPRLETVPGSFIEGMSGPGRVVNAPGQRTMAGANDMNRSNFPNGTFDISKFRGASILKPRAKR